MPNKRAWGGDGARYYLDGSTLEITYRCPYCGNWTSESFDLDDYGVELAKNGKPFFEVCTCEFCEKDTDVFPSKR